MNCTLSANWHLSSAPVFTKIWSPLQAFCRVEEKGRCWNSFRFFLNPDNAQQATGYGTFSINHLPFLTTDLQVAPTIWGLEVPCGLLIADLFLACVSVRIYDNHVGENKANRWLSLKWFTFITSWKKNLSWNINVCLWVSIKKHFTLKITCPNKSEHV